tara:strand:- start:679 stop:1089 length:411 start_codon:yes stop_codon:yes gene_type:complete
MKNNQGKTPQQIKDSTNFTMIGYIGIVIALAAILIGVGEYTGFNKEVQEGLQNDPRPKSHLWNYSHPNQWDQGECGDTLTPQDSLELLEPDAIYYDTIPDNMLDIDMDCGDDELINLDYPDENVMWIGDDGDTIWE